MKAIHTHKKPRLPPKSSLSEENRKLYVKPQGFNTFCGACCIAMPGCDEKCPLNVFKRSKRRNWKGRKKHGPQL